MPQRYAVRRAATGYGVWDAATNGWHGAHDLDEEEAHRLADAMNTRKSDRTTERRITAADETVDPGRKVAPPKRVLVLLPDGWWSGHLDHWTREHDGWYGRVRLDAGGPATWYPAPVLRPATSHP